MQAASTSELVRLSSDGEENRKERLSENTPFKQQALKTWSPALSLFGRGVIFLVLCTILFFSLVSSLLLRKFCIPKLTLNPHSGFAFGMISAALLAAAWRSNVEFTPFSDNPACSQLGGECSLSVALKGFNASPLQLPLFVYVGLSPFYQNHRRYLKSRDSSQLNGVERTLSQLGDCSPLTLASDYDALQQPLVLKPCGLPANTVYNDVFSTPRVCRFGVRVRWVILSEAGRNGGGRLMGTFVCRMRVIVWGWNGRSEASRRKRRGNENLPTHRYCLANPTDRRLPMP